VVVFDCSRFDFDGEDKTKLQRVQKFFAAVTAQVEFPNLAPAAARKLALAAARDSKLEISEDAIDLLVESWMPTHRASSTRLRSYLCTQTESTKLPLTTS